MHLQAWQWSETSDSRSRESSMHRKPYCCFSSLSICNQLVAVLIKLRRGLESLDPELDLKSVKQLTVECSQFG